MRSLEIANRTDETLRGVNVTVRPAQPFARGKVFSFEELAAGEVRRISPVDLAAEHPYIGRQAEAERSYIEAVATDASGELGRERVDVELLAYDQRPGQRALPSLIAAFSLPNSAVVDGLVRSASERLRQARAGASLDAYQSKNREAVWSQVAAIYAAVAALDVHYQIGPASFERDGQKVRTPDRIVEAKTANCLDLTMLFASCLEQAGLHPVVLFKRGHAWVGCWLV